jgi:hypothetical protein
MKKIWLWHNKKRLFALVHQLWYEENSMKRRIMLRHAVNLTGAFAIGGLISGFFQKGHPSAIYFGLIALFLSFFLIRRFWK